MQFLDQYIQSGSLVKVDKKVQRSMRLTRTFLLLVHKTQKKYKAVGTNSPCTYIYVFRSQCKGAQSSGTENNWPDFVKTSLPQDWEIFVASVPNNFRSILTENGYKELGRRNGKAVIKSSDVKYSLFKVTSVTGNITRWCVRDEETDEETLIRLTQVGMKSFGSSHVSSALMHKVNPHIKEMKKQFLLSEKYTVTKCTEADLLKRKEVRQYPAVIRLLNIEELRKYQPKP